MRRKFNTLLTYLENITTNPASSQRRKVKIAKEDLQIIEPSKKKTHAPRKSYLKEDVNVSNANKHVIVWAVLKTLSPSLSAKVPTLHS